MFDDRVSFFNEESMELNIFVEGDCSLHRLSIRTLHTSDHSLSLSILGCTKDGSNLSLLEQGFRGIIIFGELNAWLAFFVHYLECLESPEM